ncbi:xylose isomerase-like protein, partial [Tricholoma matsutake]
MHRSFQKCQKSYDCFLDDLMRCEQLGLDIILFCFVSSNTLVMHHHALLFDNPGLTVGGTTTASSISLITECINCTHKAMSYVTTILENMVGVGNIIGSDFTHLADIIKQVEDTMMVGVCMDTCTTVVCGYDIRTKDGWKYILFSLSSSVCFPMSLTHVPSMHLNDSKMELNSKHDHHKNIGIGYLGLPAFHHILTDPSMQHIPLVIETPTFELPKTVWKTESNVLNQLSGMEEEDEENRKQEGGVLQEMMKNM